MTPENITELKENEIFVFGSNLAGIHGAGAAKMALKWGAKKYQGIGLQGRTYAIPTKDAFIQTLEIYEIKLYVNDFILFAKNNPKLIFMVTQIGCGLAGYQPKDIAPLFKDAMDVENIYLPQSFWSVLKEKKIN